MSEHYSSLTTLLPGIRGRATRTDLSGDWPEEDMRMLNHIGASRWSIPLGMGGRELSPIELHYRYEAIAAASLTTALILSQRDSAVAFIASASASSLTESILQELAAGQIFATIGISQLTTSHQDGPPALRFEPTDDGYTLNGIIPWCTGASKARYIVTGASGADGEQLLFILPTDLSGIQIDPPMQLVALRASWTSIVHLKNVRLDAQWVLHGPVQKVLAGRRKTLPGGQAFLAMGLCRGALELIEASPSSSAQKHLAGFTAQLDHVRQQIMDMGEPFHTPDPQRLAEIRGACNALAVRVTHAAVALYKGSALLLSHPAQRLAREAMFLLVWSCPGAVIDCTLDQLAEDA